MYGIEMEEEDYEEQAIVCYKLIGNRRTRVYKFIGVIDCDNKINLPCNCDEDSIEAVLLPGEDWNSTDNLHNFGDYNSMWVESYIELYKHNRGALYGQGHFARYEYYNNALHFDGMQGTPVLIIYHGELLDDDGFPQLTQAEAIAIADYCAYWVKFKEGFVTNNANIINMANLLEAKYIKHIDAARVPDHLNQNQMNEILEVKTSWDRHMHSKSTKIQ